MPACGQRQRCNPSAKRRLPAQLSWVCSVAHLLLAPVQRLLPLLQGGADRCLSRLALLLALHQLLIHRLQVTTFCDLDIKYGGLSSGQIFISCSSVCLA